MLNNIRSLYNVGSIFRTGDGAGVEKIYLCGITGQPPNEMISKTALGAEEQVEWEYCEDILPLIDRLKNQGYKIVLLEQMDNSRLYEEYLPDSPVCLILGNEIDGITEEIVDYCDDAIEIEMMGLKNSLNVSVAFGIIAYHFKNCYKEKM